VVDGSFVGEFRSRSGVDELELKVRHETPAVFAYGPIRVSDVKVDYTSV